MRTRSEHYYVFGPFRLDPEESRLQKDGLIVPLTPKALAMLLMLVRNQGSLVDKETLMQELWPAQFVEEGNLTFNVSLIRKALGESAHTATYIETIPKRGYRFTAPVREIQTNSLVKSIAVLPLVIGTSHPGSEYFADGLQDALISELAQIRSLRVISRSSSNQLQGATRSLAEAARSLQLDVLVEGSVWFEADRVRINVRLIDAVNEGHLWAHNFERLLSDVPSWHSELARAIAQQIHVEVTPNENARLQDVKRVDPEAHAAYLRGRYYWHQFFTEEGLRTSISHFQRALDLDPGFAGAWAGLSGCYSAMAVQSMLPPHEAADKARSAATRAVTLDPLLAEAHIANAAVHLFFEWDWLATERAIKRALELSPSYSMAHNLFAHYAAARGWGELAIASARRGLDLDPMSAAVNVDVLWTCLLDRQYSKALEQASYMLEMKFQFPFTHVYLAQTYICLRQYLEAVRELEKILPAPDDAPASMISMLGYAYGVAGMGDASLKILKLIESASKRRYVSPYDLALVSAGLGRTDDVIRYLEQSLDDRTPRAIWLNVEPSFDGIRKDRRFGALISRLGL
jgi:DNA-binding winged helix-turn-helix (wHTH) protein/tetratricopeptide (TPR) repeat protein